MKSPFITGKTLLERNIEKLPVLLNPLLPKVGIVGLGGESSTGKSSFLFELSVAIVSKQPTFLGFPLHAQHHRAIIVATEDGEDSMALKLSRFKGQAEMHDYLDQMKFLFDSSNLVERLEQEIAQYPIDLLILDCLSDLYQDDMNSTNRIRNYLNIFNEMAAKHGFLVMILHHSQKRSQYQRPSKDNLLGSQGFEAKCRLVIELRRDLKDPQLRHMCLVKANYLPHQFTQQSFVLEFTDQQTFINTNKREEFENLVLSKAVDGKDAFLQKEVNSCIEAGITTTRDIAAALKNNGIKIGKSKVAELLKSCPSVHNPIDSWTDGQDT